MTNKKPSEREQTDQSLLSERTRADREYEARRDATEEHSDQVTEVARARADEVVREARAKADSKLEGPSGVLRGERREEDRALAETRRVETKVLSEEREARRRALAELLRMERDLTDQDLLNERSGADAALVTRDDFLGMVSHDLRTLLGGIALNAQMLQRETPADEAGARTLRRADAILRLSAGMKRLLGDLLDMVSLEAGHFGVRAEAQDLSLVIQEALDAFELSASAAGLSLTPHELPPSLPAHFDRERVLQVMANLISNALKFTPRGGSVRLHAQEEGELLRVSVSDTGPGIPADQLETIFAPFQQVNRLDRRGLGLGLHISRKIIEAHGGKIWAESVPGEGSTFHFTLPRAVP